MMAGAAGRLAVVEKSPQRSMTNGQNVKSHGYKYNREQWHPAILAA